MTAPARTRTSARPKPGTTEREHFPEESPRRKAPAKTSGKTKSAKKAAREKVPSPKKAMSKLAPKESKRETGRRAANTRERGSGSATRTRSAAAERAYARREERRDRSVRTVTERRTRKPQREEKSPPRQRRVSETKPKQLPAKVANSRLPLVVAVMSVLAAGLVSTLWLSIAAVSGSYELQQAGTEITSLSERKKTLMKRVSTMDSTPALQRRASEFMVPAPDPVHLVVRPDGSLTQVGTPVPAPDLPPKAGARPAVPPGQPAEPHRLAVSTPQAEVR